MIVSRESRYNVVVSRIALTVKILKMTSLYLEFAIIYRGMWVSAQRLRERLVKKAPVAMRMDVNSAISRRLRWERNFSRFSRECNPVYREMITKEYIMQVIAGRYYIGPCTLSGRADTSRIKMDRNSRNLWKWKCILTRNSRKTEFNQL